MTDLLQPEARGRRVQHPEQRQVLVLARPSGSLITGADLVEHLPASVEHEVVVRRHERKRDRQRCAESLAEACEYSHHARPALQSASCRSRRRCSEDVRERPQQPVRVACRSTHASPVRRRAQMPTLARSIAPVPDVVPVDKCGPTSGLASVADASGRAARMKASSSRVTACEPIVRDVASERAASQPRSSAAAARRPRRRRATTDASQVAARRGRRP